MIPVTIRAGFSRRNLRDLGQAALTALVVFALMACNQSPTVGSGGTPNPANKFSVTVRISSTDTAAQLALKYGGKVLSWHPEAGFAILRVQTRPPSTDPAIQSIDASAGTIKAPVVPTANRASRPFRNNTANADNVWIGGWTSWSGGWTSWSGGWTSWSGGSSIPALPEENTVPFAQIRLPEAQAISRNFGEGVKIAVIDTGIDLEHPAFAGRLAPASEWKDFVDDDATPQEVGTTDDHGYGHGTGVAGIILQVAPKATILPLRVLDQSGSGDLDNVVAAIDWAIERGAQVINLSLGSSGNQDSLTRELEYAASKKIYVVASAGNDGVMGGVTFPAATSEWADTGGFVFGIGSVNSNDILSDFSNYGWELFGVVPGESIYSAFPDDRTASFTGTSFAAPIFTGALALGLKELPDGGDTTAFRKYIADTLRTGQIWSENVAARGTDAIGGGRLDVEGLIRNLPNWTPKVDYADTNLVTNPTFSNDGADWNKWGTTSVVSDNGQTALKIETGSGFYQTITGLQPNTSYTFSAWMRGSAPEDRMTLNVGAFNSKNMMILAKGTTYAPHSVTFTTGPDATSAAVEVSSYDPKAQPIYVYDISLRQTGY
jgi:thermitase